MITVFELTHYNYSKSAEPVWLSSENYADLMGKNTDRSAGESFVKRMIGLGRERNKR